MENVTPDEEKAIRRLHAQMKNDLPLEKLEDKFLFYRFLKARNFNIAQAESMLRKNIRWRKEMQMDSILTEFKPQEVLQKYISNSFIGYDKEGCPVLYAAMGNTDGRGIFQSANKYNILKCVMQGTEQCVQLLETQTNKLGKPITKCVYIYDSENLTLAQATHKQSLYLFMDGVQMIQDNYPETLKRIYIINASFYFTIAFSLVKTILANAVVDKIRVYGEKGWKEELLETFNPDDLPAFLGGNRTDPDGNPRCKTFINFGGKVPESYYGVKDVSKYAQNDDVNFIRVERQDCNRVTVNVTEPGSVLHWEFLLRNHNIGFGLHLETSENSIEELIPVHKINTEIEPHADKYICKELGTYYIILDNTYSWIFSKEVWYRTWVTYVQ